MAQTRVDILGKIVRFVKAANSQIDIKKVVLYGSHIKGETDEWSDIDLAVVSDDFKSMTLKERLLLLKKIAWVEGLTEIDALGYSETEFESEHPLDFVVEIKEHGIVVYDKNDSI